MKNVLTQLAIPSSLKSISGMAHSGAISAQNFIRSTFVSGVLNFGESLPHLFVAKIPIFFVCREERKTDSLTRNCKW